MESNVTGDKVYLVGVEDDGTFEAFDEPYEVAEYVNELLEENAAPLRIVIDIATKA